MPKKKPYSGKRHWVYRIIEILQDGDPWSVIDLAENTKLGRKTVLCHMNQLWVMDLVYIYAWRAPQGGGKYMPVYKWGKKEDIEKPPKLTHAQKCANYRKRHKAVLSARRRIYRERKRNEKLQQNQG